MVSGIFDGGGGGGGGGRLWFIKTNFFQLGYYPLD